MRAILDLRTNKVLRNCGSISGSIRTFSMLQIERDRTREVWRKAGRKPTKVRDFKLAIVELTTTRHIGDTVPAGEFTIIHSEK